MGSVSVEELWDAYGTHPELLSGKVWIVGCEDWLFEHKNRYTSRIEFCIFDSWENGIEDKIHGPCNSPETILVARLCEPRFRDLYGHRFEIAGYIVEIL